jgi:hypothetical protein
MVRSRDYFALLLLCFALLSFVLFSPAHILPHFSDRSQHDTTRYFKTGVSSWTTSQSAWRLRIVWPFRLLDSNPFSGFQEWASNSQSAPYHILFSSTLSLDLFALAGVWTPGYKPFSNLAAGYLVAGYNRIPLGDLAAGYDGTPLNAGSVDMDGLLHW